MENKFRVGEKVRLNSKVEDFTYGKGEVKYSELGKIKEIRNNLIAVDFPSNSAFICKKDELVSVNFEVGDTVKIRGNVTLDEIKENNFNNCRTNTMRFLEKASYADFEEEYTIKVIRSSGSLEFEECDYVVNPVIFEIVEKHKEEPKEMTVEEISKELGYEVKIVKGDK